MQSLSKKIINLYQNKSQNSYHWDERLRYWLGSLVSKRETSVFLSLLFLFFEDIVVMGTMSFLVFIIFPKKQLTMRVSHFGMLSSYLSIEVR
jgi:hypothetical protein